MKVTALALLPLASAFVAPVQQQAPLTQVAETKAALEALVVQCDSVSCKGKR